ncbi:MAG TPA: hypothetical protein VNI84_08160, partial [Pyrinomonadaceae bacterium]|nr:hypothetical protein [Pyrinomonadaceae bacterium]
TKREGDLADRRKTLDKLNTDAERLGEKRQYKAPVWRLPEMSYEETVKARKRIAPDAADLTKFKDFLRIYIERLTVKKL